MGRKLAQHRIVGTLDALHRRRLVQEALVAGVNQHRGVDLEHDDISRCVEPAIDSEIIETDAPTDFVQRLQLRRLEHDNDRGDPLRGKEFREEEFPELQKVRTAGSAES